LNDVRYGDRHVLVNLFTAVNAAVIFPTSTVAFVEEWKKRNAGFHTELKASSVNESLFTTSEELADTVQVTLVCAPTIAQSRTASESSLPKNNAPLGVENDETTPPRSGGVTDPKIATSSVGMASNDCPRRVSFDGGVTVEDSTYFTN